MYIVVLCSSLNTTTFFSFYVCPPTSDNEHRCFSSRGAQRRQLLSDVRFKTERRVCCVEITEETSWGFIYSHAISLLGITGKLWTWYIASSRETNTGSSQRKFRSDQSDPHCVSVSRRFSRPCSMNIGLNTDILRIHTQLYIKWNELGFHFKIPNPP
jgi:hypothetical protein